MCQIYTQADRWTGINIRTRSTFWYYNYWSTPFRRFFNAFYDIGCFKFVQFGLQRREQVYRHASWRVHSEWHRISFQTYSVLTRHAAQTFEPVGLFNSRIETGIGVGCIDGGEADCGYKSVDSMTTQKRLVDVTDHKDIDGHATEDAR
jgi:hypothetical protein